MRLTLIASGRPVRSTGGTAFALSAVMHIAALAALVSSPSVEERVESFDEPLPQGLSFLVPPSAAPEEAVTALQYSEEGGGQGAPDGALVADEGNRFAEERGGLDSLSNGAVAQDEVPDAATAFASAATLPADVFMVVEVDSAAERDPTSAAPAYPPEMQARQIEGYVAVRFVVDTTGKVDLSTVQVVLASRQEFARAVREALPGMRFRPARMGDTPVRQLAEQMFRFQLPRPVVVPPPPPGLRRPVTSPLAPRQT